MDAVETMTASVLISEAVCNGQVEEEVEEAVRVEVFVDLLLTELLADEADEAEEES